MCYPALMREKAKYFNNLLTYISEKTRKKGGTVAEMYSVSQKKGYPLKSGYSVERSNLNALTP